MANVGLKCSMIVLCLAWWAASIVTVDGEMYRLGKGKDAEICWDDHSDCERGCKQLEDIPLCFKKPGNFEGKVITLWCCSNNPIGAIIGGVVGFIVLIVIIVLCCFFCPCCPGYKRRHPQVVYAQPPPHA